MVTAVAVVVAVPAAASAASHGGTPRAVSAAAGETVLGGFTHQDWPVVLTLSKSRRQVVRATIGLRLTCVSGNGLGLPDTYRRLSVSKSSRKFSASFGPETVRNEDGTTSDYEGSVSGKLNAAGTKASGKWQLKLVDHDAAGTVTNTCNSGTVSWNASR
jgi:hypothetical protein